MQVEKIEMAGKLRPPLALEARRLTMAGHRRRGGGGGETAPAHRGATHPPAGPTPATNPMGPSTQGQIILQLPLTHPEVPWKSHTPGNDCMMPSSAKTGSCNPSILLHSVLQRCRVSKRRLQNNIGFHFTTLLGCNIAQPFSVQV